MNKQELDLFEHYKYIKNNNILLSFKGALSQEILVDMGTLLKEQVSVRKKIKKIFSVFVELAQNIMHYSREKEVIGSREIGIGMLVFTESRDYYNMISGNAIESKQAGIISGRIDTVNSLSDDALKAYFKQERTKNSSKESKGAGLGFIEIARKSKNKIEYEINKIDDETSFLILSIKIDKEK